LFAQHILRNVWNAHFEEKKHVFDLFSKLEILKDVWSTNPSKTFDEIRKKESIKWILTELLFKFISCARKIFWSLLYSGFTIQGHISILWLNAHQFSWVCHGHFKKNQGERFAKQVQMFKKYLQQHWRKSNFLLSVSRKITRIVRATEIINRLKDNIFQKREFLLWISYKLDASTMTKKKS